MKKIKILLVVLLMIVCVDVNASIPAGFKDVPSATTLQQGDTVTISTNVVSGTAVGIYTYFDYDEDVFEFVSVESDYGFKYDFDQKGMVNENAINYSSDDIPFVVWSTTFKVKDDAKIGEATINGQTYQIIDKSNVADEEMVVEDDNTVIEENIESNGINIFLITTIVFGLIALIELVFIVVKKNKKA